MRGQTKVLPADLYRVATCADVQILNSAGSRWLLHLVMQNAMRLCQFTGSHRRTH